MKKKREREKDRRRTTSTWSETKRPRESSDQFYRDTLDLAHVCLPADGLGLLYDGSTTVTNSIESRLLHSTSCATADKKEEGEKKKKRKGRRKEKKRKRKKKRWKRRRRKKSKAWHACVGGIDDTEGGGYSVYHAIGSCAPTKKRERERGGRIYRLKVLAHLQGIVFFTMTSSLEGWSGRR